VNEIEIGGVPQHNPYFLESCPHDLSKYLIIIFYEKIFFMKSKKNRAQSTGLASRYAR